MKTLHPVSLRRIVLWLLLVLLGAGLVWTARPSLYSADEAPAGQLELRKGDHVCIIGNALAERMQHDGWLETYLHARFPQHDLVFRNLGFSGDEVAGFTDKP